MKERPAHRPARDAEAPERARIRKLLLDRGVPPARIGEPLIDFWIVQDARDQEEARSRGCRRPSSMFFGSGQ